MTYKTLVTKFFQIFFFKRLHTLEFSQGSPGRASDKLPFNTSDFIGESS